MQIKRGKTLQIIPVQANDTTSVIGGGKTGLVFNTSGLIAYYKRELAASATAITLITATVGTWTSGGFKEIDATHMPGSYELSLPDAAISASDASTWVEIYLSGASGAYFPPLRIDLEAIDRQDAVRQGLTALPNANAAATDGLPTVDASNAVKVQSGTGANQISLSNGQVTVSANNDKTDYALSASGVQAIWDALTSALATVGSIGKLLVDNVNAAIASRLAASSYVAPDNAGIAAVEAKTAQLTFTVANRVDASVPAASDPLSSVVPGSYASGSAGYALGQIADIEAQTDKIIGPSVPFVSPVGQDGTTTTLYVSRDYVVGNGQPLNYPIQGLDPTDIITWSVARAGQGPLILPGVYVANSPTPIARVQPTANDTATLAGSLGLRRLEIFITNTDGDKSERVYGWADVKGVNVP